MKYAVSSESNSIRIKDVVVGPANEFAVAAAKMLLQKGCSRIYNPYCLYGGVGVGKSILVKAIGNEIGKRKRGAQVCYMRAVELFDKYIQALQGGYDTRRFREEFRNLDCLILDDIEDVITSRQFEDELFHILQYLAISKRKIVVASNQCVLKMRGITDRLKALLSGGLNIEIKPPKFEQRLLILKRKAFQAKCHVNEDELKRMARKYTDVNEMIGAFHIFVVRMFVERNGL